MLRNVTEAALITAVTEKQKEIGDAWQEIARHESSCQGSWDRNSGCPVGHIVTGVWSGNMAFRCPSAPAM